MDDQFLYRYFDASGTPLYNGRSNDWTRRLREHWREDDWCAVIASVRVERHPDLVSVVAAEAASIRIEHPKYNVQHNRPGSLDPELAPGSGWTAGDIIVIVGVAVLAVYLVYKGTTIAVEKYRAWNADRAEFLTWKQAHVAETEPQPATDEDEPGPVAASRAAPGVGTEPAVVSIVTPQPATTQPMPLTPTVQTPVAAYVVAMLWILTRRSDIDMTTLTRPTQTPATEQ